MPSRRGSPWWSCDWGARAKNRSQGSATPRCPVRPSILPNIWFNFKDVMGFDFESRAHPEIAMTIQSPPGNNSNHPLGNDSKGPYTKDIPHFQGVVPQIPPLNFGPPNKTPPPIVPPVVHALGGGGGLAPTHWGRHRPCLSTGTPCYCLLYDRGLCGPECDVTWVCVCGV